MSASLVVQTSFLGDVILTTPLLAELATRGPVDVVTTPAAAPLLAHNPAIRHLIVYDKRGHSPEGHNFWHTAQAIRESFAGEPERTAYLAQGSLRSAALTFVAGFHDRVGFDTSAARALYTRRVHYREDLHHVERLWRLASSKDAPAPPRETLRPKLYPGRAEQIEVDELLEHTSYELEPMIALAPGSMWATKQWPYYAELAAALTESERLRVVLIGGSDDVALNETVAAACSPQRPAINATAKLSLLASADLIGRCHALVTNDSAPQHLASAMGTPTVSIFGPTVPAFGFGPLAPHHAVAGVDTLPCRPCDRHGPRRCPLTHWRCMREITPAHIQELIERVVFPEDENQED